MATEEVRVPARGGQFGLRCAGMPGAPEGLGQFRSVVSFLTLWGRVLCSPKIDYTKMGALILFSLLQDLGFYCKAL